MLQNRPLSGTQEEQHSRSIMKQKRMKLDGMHVLHLHTVAGKAQPLAAWHTC